MVGQPALISQETNLSLLHIYKGYGVWRPRKRKARIFQFWAFDGFVRYIICRETYEKQSPGPPIFRGEREKETLYSEKSWATQRMDMEKLLLKITK